MKHTNNWSTKPETAKNAVSQSMKRLNNSLSDYLSVITTLKGSSQGVNSPR
ncbi:MAG: hypothetical protein HRT88_12495 [Lentisphaeraceae bacterium]|nr:hypothetical protein [Lentisphaeraceae bacterium]